MKIVFQNLNSFLTSSVSALHKAWEESSAMHAFMLSPLHVVLNVRDKKWSMCCFNIKIIFL